MILTRLPVQYTRLAQWPHITPPDIPDHFSSPLSTDFLVESSLVPDWQWLSKTVKLIKYKTCSSQSARPGKDRPASAQDFLFSDANGGSSPGGCRAKIDVSDSADCPDW